MHSVLRNRLSAIYREASQTRTGSKAQTYLRLLGPIHNTWHSTRARRLGFLTFHWYVVGYFKRIRGPQFLGGISPYTTQQFAALGAPYDADVNVPSGGLTELEDFSRSIEGWHNDTHMNISMADGVDLMNALTNIFIPQFWRLHFFIDNEFQRKLRDYGRGVVSNPTPANVIRYIENNSHWAVPLI